jgi:hypothetical protein
MPLGAEVAHAARFIAEGSPGAIGGLIVGAAVFYPSDCQTEIGDADREFCSNVAGHAFPASGGFPVELEWLGQIAGCIIIGAVAWWLLSWLWRFIGSE